MFRSRFNKGKHVTLNWFQMHVRQRWQCPFFNKHIVEMISEKEFVRIIWNTNELSEMTCLYKCWPAQNDTTILARITLWFNCMPKQKQLSLFFLLSHERPNQFIIAESSKCECHPQITNGVRIFKSYKMN